MRIFVLKSDECQVPTNNERTLSQVNYVKSSCGDKLKEDNIKLRAVLRRNDASSETHEHWVIVNRSTGIYFVLLTLSNSNPSEYVCFISNH